MCANHHLLGVTSTSTSTSTPTVSIAHTPYSYAFIVAFVHPICTTQTQNTRRLQYLVFVTTPHMLSFTEYSSMHTTIPSISSTHALTYRSGNLIAHLSPTTTHDFLQATYMVPCVLYDAYHPPPAHLRDSFISKVCSLDHLRSHRPINTPLYHKRSSFGNDPFTANGYAQQVCPSYGCNGHGSSSNESTACDTDSPGLH